MMRMHNPPHPGEILRDTVLHPDSSLTLTAFAERLGVSRVALSRVVNGRAAVSAELAIRLAAALGGSAESWLRMQSAYDLWQAQKNRRPKIGRLTDSAGRLLRSMNETADAAARAGLTPGKLDRLLANHS
jgi:addiction module HigA family antidote